LPFKKPKRVEARVPISPILFNLVMDRLGGLIQKGVDDMRIDTFLVNGAKSISHLISTDGILIFSKANPEFLNSIMEILGVFLTFSGLEVNNEKSSAHYSNVVDHPHLKEILDFFLSYSLLGKILVNALDSPAP